ncbi:hypothetical protein Tco_0432039 [Tanacetum coccineum]
MMANDEVHNPNSQNTSPSEINKPYEPSPMMDSYEQSLCLGLNFVSEALRKCNQMHQTFKKSYLAMTDKLNDMIKLPKLQPKKTYKDDLECEMVMVKVPRCMSWLDAYNEPIGDLDIMEDEAENPSPQMPKVDDVSLVDGVFDGAFDGDGGRILLWEKGRGEEKCGEGGEEHGEGDYLTRMDMINEVKHES